LGEGEYGDHEEPEEDNRVADATDEEVLDPAPISDRPVMHLDVNDEQRKQLSKETNEEVKAGDEASPVALLEQDALVDQGAHVEDDVGGVGVREGRGEEPVELPAFHEGRGAEASHFEHRFVAAIKLEKVVGRVEQEDGLGEDAHLAPELLHLLSDGARLLH